ncbi:hypothetical protein GGI43DRAFT_415226 [Trichoderma evansii]
MEFSIPLCRLFLFSLIPLVKAYTVFPTTCSAPDPQSEFMFVSGPNTRGTLNILWSSLFTIFACTWTVQHPPILEQRNGRNLGILGDLKWGLIGIGRSATIMIVTALAPEFIMGDAYHSLEKAREVQKEMQKYADADGVTWTLTHSYFAIMGGFAIRSKPSREKQLDRLSIGQVYELRRRELIKPLPDIAVEEIKDKSKSDSFGKMIAIGQILWTVVQIIARAAKKLPVSPLEIAVVGFAICAIITYSLYWYKPQRAHVPIAILDYPEQIPAEVVEACGSVASKKEDASLPEPEAANISLKLQTGDWGSAAVIATAVSTTVFGGVHILAWHFAFPMKIELIGWRCTSVYSAAFPLCLLS